MEAILFVAFSKMLIGFKLSFSSNCVQPDSLIGFFVFSRGPILAWCRHSGKHVIVKWRNAKKIKKKNKKIYATRINIAICKCLLEKRQIVDLQEMKLLPNTGIEFEIAFRVAISH